jgi:Tol biopolymer transport system component
VLIRAASLVAAIACLAPLAASAGASAASDGQIVFSTNRAQNLLRHALYSIRANGTGRQLVALPAPSIGYAVFSPDRRRMLFVRQVGLDYALFIARPDGTQARRLGPPALLSSLADGGAAFSPDGRRVAFVAYEPCSEKGCVDYGIYVIGTDGSGFRQVASGIEPSWSPDGLLLAFSGAFAGSNDPHEAFVVSLASGMTWGLGPGRRPVFAPRGRRVAYTSLRGREALCSVRFDGTARRCVRGPDARAITWSPDAKRVAFQLGFQGRLAVVDASGRRMRLFRGSQSSPGAWSPDGRRIAFVSGRSGQIRVRSADGPSVARAVTREARGTDFRDIRWRAGRITYVTSLMRNDHELALLGSDGRGLKILTRNDQEDLDPAWSPNRGTIAFSRGDGLTASLRLIAPDGTRDRLLTARGPWRDTSPAWSPDGRQVAFVRTDRYFYVGRLVVIDLATTRERTLVPGPRVLPDQVSWSPDGTMIAFGSQHGGPGADLHVVNVDGTGFRRLNTGREWATAPAWSPDGLRIAFTGTPLEPPQSNRWSLFTIRPNGGGLVEVARDTVNSDGAAWSPDAGRLVFARRIPGTFDLVSMLVATEPDGGGETRLTSHYSSNVAPAWHP